MKEPFRPAVFLDRDGVLIPDTGYPHKIHDAKLFPDVAPALRRLQTQYQLLVVSNQSGVRRGFFSAQDVEHFNAALVQSLISSGVQLSKEHFFICPHRPNDNCACRKPKPGLLLNATKLYSVDLVHSYLVGDSETDIEAGQAAGVLTIRINRRKTPLETTARWVVSDLMEAADVILRTRPQERSIGRSHFLETSD